MFYLSTVTFWSVFLHVKTNYTFSFFLSFVGINISSFFLGENPRANLNPQVGKQSVAALLLIISATKLRFLATENSNFANYSRH